MNSSWLLLSLALALFGQAQAYIYGANDGPPTFRVRRFIPMIRDNFVDVTDNGDTESQKVRSEDFASWQPVNRLRTRRQAVIGADGVEPVQVKAPQRELPCQTTNCDSAPGVGHRVILYPVASSYPRILPMTPYSAYPYHASVPLIPLSSADYTYPHTPLGYVPATPYLGSHVPVYLENYVPYI